MSILDDEEKIMNQSDWLVERDKVYGMINYLRDDQQHMMERMNWLENKNAELRAELDFIKRNITISKPVDFYQQCMTDRINIRF